MTLDRKALITIGLEKSRSLASESESAETTEGIAGDIEDFKKHKQPQRTSFP
jgi:hypothetical protein